MAPSAPTIPRIVARSIDPSSKLRLIRMTPGALMAPLLALLLYSLDFACAAALMVVSGRTNHVVDGLTHAHTVAIHHGQQRIGRAFDIDNQVGINDDSFMI